MDSRCLVGLVSGKLVSNSFIEGERRRERSKEPLQFWACSTYSRDGMFYSYILKVCREPETESDKIR